MEILFLESFLACGICSEVGRIFVHEFLGGLKILAKKMLADEWNGSIKC